MTPTINHSVYQSYEISVSKHELRFMVPLRTQVLLLNKIHKFIHVVSNCKIPLRTTVMEQLVPILPSG